MKTVLINNFRRLKNVEIDLESETTIFVGANNSGKTSATAALRLLVKGRGKDLSIFDFSASCLESLRGFDVPQVDEELELPAITLDLWFAVTEDELHRVIDLLPSLDWADQPVGIRLEYRARDSAGLLARYHEAKPADQPEAIDGYRPWPTSLQDYLEKKLHTGHKR